MAVRTLKIVEDNTAPPIELTLERDNGDGTASAIDLTGCSVDLILQQVGGSITNAGHQTCVITDATGGGIQYTPQDGDFPIAGKYIADAKITYGDDSVEVVYEQQKWKVRSKIT